MTPIDGVGQFLGKWVAKALGGPKALLRNITAATLSVIEYCAELFDLGVVDDIHRIKELMIQRGEAETTIVKADAIKKMAEAAEVENRANLFRRNDKLSQLERKKLELENVRTRAEIEEIETRTRTARETAMMDAKTRFLEACHRLRSEGGAMYFNKKDLHRFLGMGLPSDEEPPELPSE